MKPHDEDDDEVVPNWPKVRDLLDQIMTKAKDWETATCIATREEMAGHFRESFPDVWFTFEDIHLALHDLNVPYERNEHNNKFYYLANWRS